MQKTHDEQNIKMLNEDKLLIVSFIILSYCAIQIVISN